MRHNNISGRCFVINRTVLTGKISGKIHGKTTQNGAVFAYFDLLSESCGKLLSVHCLCEGLVVRDLKNLCREGLLVNSNGDRAEILVKGTMISGKESGIYVKVCSVALADACRTEAAAEAAVLQTSSDAGSGFYQDSAGYVHKMADGSLWGASNRAAGVDIDTPHA